MKTFNKIILATALTISSLALMGCDSTKAGTQPKHNLCIPGYTEDGKWSDCDGVYTEDGEPIDRETLENGWDAPEEEEEVLDITYDRVVDFIEDNQIEDLNELNALQTQVLADHAYDPKVIDRHPLEEAIIKHTKAVASAVSVMLHKYQNDGTYTLSSSEWDELFDYLHYKEHYVVIQGRSEMKEWQVEEDAEWPVSRLVWLHLGNTEGYKISKKAFLRAAKQGLRKVLED